MKKTNLFNLNTKSKIRNYLNYKDFFLLLSLWYLISFLIIIINNFEFTNNSPALEKILEYSFLGVGRFIFLALAIFYFISMYNFTLKDLKFNFKIKLQLLFQLFLIIVFLILVALIFINIPLSLNQISTKNFKPLFYINSPTNFVNSIVVFSFFFLINIIMTIAEIFILENVSKEFLTNIVGEKSAILLSALLYPFLLLLNSKIYFILFFLLAFIYFILIKKFNSIFYAAIFGSTFYTILFIYIYGWKIFYL